MARYNKPEVKPAVTAEPPAPKIEMVVEAEPVVGFFKKVGTHKGADISVRNIGVLNGGALVIIDGVGVTFIKDVYWNEQRNDFARA